MPTSKKIPSRGLYIFIGAVIGAFVPPFVLGLFQLDITYPPLSPVFAGAAGGWVYHRVRYGANPPPPPPHP